jgi:hemoglobin-like flavoprotein
MPLSENTQRIVKNSVPLLQAHGHEIAQRTYAILFEKYPQTQPLFSRTVPEQAQRLAGVIIRYCDNIDQLEVLHQALDEIAQRHAAADIHPGHYPMLGHSLLQAVKEVLGAEANDELVNAWKEAYFYLADILIEKERVLKISAQ